MSKIAARLFGGFELRSGDGKELTLSTRKARALLAFLVVESGQWHSREKLAGLLWADSAQTQARNSLNQALLCGRTERRRFIPIPDIGRMSVGPLGLSVDYVRYRE